MFHAGIPSEQTTFGGSKKKIKVRGVLKAANHRSYVLFTNLSSASPEATWNSDKPELIIAPPFLTRRP